MPKTYAPFMQLTRREPIAGFENIALVNVDDILMVRCTNTGGARVYIRAEPYMSQWIDPVENFAFFVHALTELTLTLQPAEEDSTE